jgi:DNA-binding NtrC family response regulator
MSGLWRDTIRFSTMRRMAKDISRVARRPEAPEVRVLVATSDVPYGDTLARFLEVDDYQVERIHDAKGVLRVASRKPFQVVVLDLDLGHAADVDLITYVRRQLPMAKLVLLFEMTRIERAIEGLRQGAFFYLPRDSEPSDVALVVGKAVRSLGTEATMQRYERDLLNEIVGGAASMKRVVEQVSKVAPTDSTVLLLGESGVGKEVLATTIHRLSPRNDMPFVTVNCAALPENLLESELFGHVKGAFTGADVDKQGLFAEADGGTIFLDEIGDMALITQAKLLRVLQNGEVRAVGAVQTRRVDVRVIAATNRDLEEAVREMAFREDLYFRLNVIQIRIPPLRERMEALPKLVDLFVQRSNTQYGKNVHRIDEESEILLRNYSYPGNIRELESIIAHAVIMSDDGVIRAKDLPDVVRKGERRRLALPDLSAESIPSISDMERDLIITALDRLDGNQTEAAKRLGISRSTLWRKMKDYDINR